MNLFTLRISLLIGLCSLVVGCGTIIDTAKHELGYERRDILVSNVQTARNSEDSAKQQFQTTLQQFQAVTHFNGGDLETEYNKLNSAYQDSDKKAQDVRNQIDRVDKTASQMFTEWNGELSQYSNSDLRQKSENELKRTKDAYAVLIKRMHDAADKMTPVLAAFKDQVLFLKHNLNAQAIASLSTTAAGIDSDVANLIKEMEASIAEADDFVNKMKSPTK